MVHHDVAVFISLEAPPFITSSACTALACHRAKCNFRSVTLQIFTLKLFFHTGTATHIEVKVKAKSSRLQGGCREVCRPTFIALALTTIPPIARSTFPLLDGCALAPGRDERYNRRTHISLLNMHIFEGCPYTLTIVPVSPL
jgi:hypothetical protein